MREMKVKKHLILFGEVLEGTPQQGFGKHCIIHKIQGGLKTHWGGGTPASALSHSAVGVYEHC